MKLKIITEGVIRKKSNGKYGIVGHDGKFWNASYDSEEDAKAALRAYHAQKRESVDNSQDSNIYKEHGYNSRKEYLKDVAYEYGIDYKKVIAIASALGPEEDFDGLISMIEDMYL